MIEIIIIEKTYERNGIFYPFLVIYKQLQFLTNFPASKSLENCANFSKLWSKSFSVNIFQIHTSIIFREQLFLRKIRRL